MGDYADRAQNGKLQEIGQRWGPSASGRAARTQAVTRTSSAITAVIDNQ